MWAVLLICVLCTTLVSAAPSEDEITSLPGLKTKLKWKQYSGYLKASGTKKLHYWFLQSQSSTPEKDPVVLWMNGGPGCSSDLGLLSEHGPFRISNDSQTVLLNNFSWNKIANMIYLEAPAGVGFSYSDDKKYATNDDIVANDNHLAMKDFFTKFPELQKNEFYITGESYGGIYVPTLSALIVDDPSFNFKGFMVGNGLSDSGMNLDSLIYFAYYHGLIGDSDWKELSKCCNGNMTRCEFHTKAGEEEDCRAAVIKVQMIVYQSGLNEYNLYGKCESSNQGVWFDKTTGKLTYSLFPWHYSLKNSNLSQNMEVIRMWTDRDNLRLTPPCLNYDNVLKYMRTKEVRKALHIADVVQEWDICSSAVGADYRTLYNTMKPQYLKVLAKKKRAMVYNGDVDMACNFLGDEWFTDSLGLKVKEARKPWHMTLKDKSKQVAGFIKQFENLSFITIKGAGHMVPTDKPPQALHMFTNFIWDTPFM
ncbi:hypothetical protein FSP39_009530 [Pinctada imbricata]|uniref:Carboxypeptidase n=1 Tax=Pinctada imbricata TaxID=66713 RepID=A0AA89BX50_PINIB|nr:hypothetical protein FSP39_009530 [Pinctada imbricata]